MKWSYVVLPLIAACCGAADLVPGASWNESKRYTDPLTGAPVLQLTTRGLYNQGPTIHFLSGWSGGSREVVFATVRDGRSALMSGDVENGEIKVQFVGPELSGYDENNPRKTFAASGKWLEGVNIAASPRNRLAAAIVCRTGALHLIDLEKQQSTLLVDPARHPEEWVNTPVFSADGKSVAVPTGLVKKFDPAVSTPMAYYLYPVDGKGERRELFRTEYGQTHFFPNPKNPDLWIVKSGRPAFRSPDRDAAMRTPSCFLLNIATGERRPILPRSEYKDITHLSWNFRGDRIVYHASAFGGGNCVGAMTADGNVIWEHVFKKWHPERNGLNHIVADTVDDFIFDDGLAVPGQISLLDYRNAGRDGAPRILPVAEWKNDWKAMPGQLTHPHPAVSPDGSKLFAARSAGGRVHVYIVDLNHLRR